jgi:hypothetical protein
MSRPVILLMSKSVEKYFVLLIIFFLISSAHVVSEGTESNGGKSFVKFPATGFFHVVHYQGDYWLAMPDGSPFYTICSNTVHPYGDYAPKLGYSPYNRNVIAKAAVMNTYSMYFLRDGVGKEIPYALPQDTIRKLFDEAA